MFSLIIERAPEEQKTGSKNLLAPVEGIIGAGFCHRRIRWWCHFRICLLGVAGRRGDPVCHTAEKYILLIRGSGSKS